MRRLSEIRLHWSTWLGIFCLLEVVALCLGTIVGARLAYGQTETFTPTRTRTPTITRTVTNTPTVTKTATKTPNNQFGTSFEFCRAAVDTATATPTGPQPFTPTVTPTSHTITPAPTYTRTPQQFAPLMDQLGMTTSISAGSSFTLIDSSTRAPAPGQGLCQMEMLREAGGSASWIMPLSPATSSAHLCFKLDYDASMPFSDWTELATFGGAEGLQGCTLSARNEGAKLRFQVYVGHGDTTFRCKTSQNPFTRCECTDPAKPVNCTSLNSGQGDEWACRNFGSGGEASCGPASVLTTGLYQPANTFQICLSEQHDVKGPGGILCEFDAISNDGATDGTQQIKQAVTPYGNCDAASADRYNWACYSSADCNEGGSSTPGTCLVTALPIHDLTTATLGSANSYSWPSRVFFDTVIAGSGLANTERKIDVLRIAPDGAGSNWATGWSQVGGGRDSNCHAGNTAAAMYSCIDDGSSGAIGNCDVASGIRSNWACENDADCGGTGGTCVYNHPLTVNTADYGRLSTGSPNQQRSFSVADIASLNPAVGENILGLSFAAWARRDVTGTGTSTRFMRSGVFSGAGDLCAGDAYNFSSYNDVRYKVGAYTWCPRQPCASPPCTTPWSSTAVNQIEAGLQRTASSPAGSLSVTALQGEVLVTKAVTPAPSNMIDRNADSLTNVVVLGDSTHDYGNDLINTLSNYLPSASGVLNMAVGGMATYDLYSHVANLMTTTTDGLFTCRAGSGTCGVLPDYTVFQIGANDKHSTLGGLNGLPALGRGELVNGNYEGCYGGPNDGKPCLCPPEVKRARNAKTGITGFPVVADGPYTQVDGSGLTTLTVCPTSKKPARRLRATSACQCGSDSIGTTVNGTPCITDSNCSGGFSKCVKTCDEDGCGVCAQSLFGGFAVNPNGQPCKSSATCPGGYPFCGLSGWAAMEQQGCTSRDCPQGVCLHEAPATTNLVLQENLIAKILTSSANTHLVLVLPPRALSADVGALYGFFNWGGVSDRYDQISRLYRRMRAQYGTNRVSIVNMEAIFKENCQPYLSCYGAGDGIHYSIPPDPGLDVWSQAIADCLNGTGSHPKRCSNKGSSVTCTTDSDCGAGATCESPIQCEGVGTP